MVITFNITTSESNIIAEQYGYNASIHPNKDAFVLEQFKIFGRTCIEAKAFQVALESEKVKTKASIENTKASISF